jgi:hypothetical protein
MKQRVARSLSCLDQWIGSNGWAGLDPFSALERPLFLRLQRAPRVLPLRILRYPFFASLGLFPAFWNRALGCRPQVNAKAMGLFAKAYLNLYEKTGKDEHFGKSRECLEWLERHGTPGYAGLCWGYPFDWQSHVFFPKGTPSSVVSFTAGDAFWRAYRVTGGKNYLDICESICLFFMNDLKQDRRTDTSLCFSYTPLDRMHVHNANLFTAEFLIRVGYELNRTDFLQAGMAALQYSLEGQRRDGAWPYYGEPDTYPNIVDHYHTGFVLRMLHAIYGHTGDSRVLKAMRTGLAYYLAHLFHGETLPKYSDEKTWPVDIHACAEGILCLNEMKAYDSRGGKVLENLLTWTLGEMQDEDGHFYYMKKKHWTLTIPYVRWSQAWMLLALSEVLESQAESRGI